MAESPRLRLRQFEYALGARSDTEGLPAAGRRGADDLAGSGEDAFTADAQFFQDVGGQVVRLCDQA